MVGVFVSLLRGPMAQGMLSSFSSFCSERYSAANHSQQLRFFC
jgi:hypothetical protein